MRYYHNTPIYNNNNTTYPSQSVHSVTVSDTTVTLIHQFTPHSSVIAPPASQSRPPRSRRRACPWPVIFEKRFNSLSHTKKRFNSWSNCLWSRKLKKMFFFFDKILESQITKKVQFFRVMLKRGSILRVKLKRECSIL